LAKNSVTYFMDGPLPREAKRSDRRLWMVQRWRWRDTSAALSGRLRLKWVQTKKPLHSNPHPAAEAPSTDSRSNTKTISCLLSVCFSLSAYLCRLHITIQDITVYSPPLYICVYICIFVYI